jgi:hypothetical protein
MALHKRRPGETVAQERTRLRPKSKRASKTLPSQASATARGRAFGQQGLLKSAAARNKVKKVRKLLPNAASKVALKRRRFGVRRIL